MSDRYKFNQLCKRLHASASFPVLEAENGREGMLRNTRIEKEIMCSDGLCEELFGKMNKKLQKEKTMENIWNKFNECKPTKDGEYIVIYDDHTVHVEILKDNELSNQTWFAKKAIYWTLMVYSPGYKEDCEGIRNYMKYNDLTEDKLCLIIRSGELKETE